jgi:hypothetical protein
VWTQRATCARGRQPSRQIRRAFVAYAGWRCCRRRWYCNCCCRFLPCCHVFAALCVARLAAVGCRYRVSLCGCVRADSLALVRVCSACESLHNHAPLCVRMRSVETALSYSNPLHQSRLNARSPVRGDLSSAVVGAGASVDGAAVGVGAGVGGGGAPRGRSVAALPPLEGSLVSSNPAHDLTRVVGSSNEAKSRPTTAWEAGATATASTGATSRRGRGVVPPAAARAESVAAGDVSVVTAVDAATVGNLSPRLSTSSSSGPSRRASVTEVAAEVALPGTSSEPRARSRTTSSSPSMSPRVVGSRHPPPPGSPAAASDLTFYRAGGPRRK